MTSNLIDKPVVYNNPFNYSGAKHNLIPVIKNNLPKKCYGMIDLFGGSGELVTNFVDNFEQLWYNEKNTYIYDIINVLSMFGSDYIIDTIKKYIAQFNLDKYNKQEFLNFRQWYNEEGRTKLPYPEKSIVLYTLMCYSFNYFCTIDKNGKYVNTSGYGRSSFNSSLENKLINYCDILQKNALKINYTNLDFRDFYKNMSNVSDFKTLLVMADVPYLNSDDTYSRSSGLKWTKQDDKDVFDMLDELHAKGGNFMYFNTTKCNDKVNEDLVNWMQKYKTIHAQDSFYNCSYQRKNGKTSEVIIVNYDV